MSKLNSNALGELCEKLACLMSVRHGWQELRQEDYAANRKGPQQGATGLFGGGAQPATTGFSGFGQAAKPAAFTGGGSHDWSNTGGVYRRVGRPISVNGRRCLLLKVS